MSYLRSKLEWLTGQLPGKGWGPNFKGKYLYGSDFGEKRDGWGEDVSGIDAVPKQ